MINPTSYIDRLEEFEIAITAALQVGSVLENPGGGQSEIRRVNAGRLVYRRGDSNIQVAVKDFFDAYQCFRGHYCSGPELRAFRPSVFDSANGGHSCNCTLLLLALKSMGLVRSIVGEGKRGAPFGACILLR